MIAEHDDFCFCNFSPQEAEKVNTRSLTYSISLLVPSNVLVVDIDFLVLISGTRVGQSSKRKSQKA